VLLIVTPSSWTDNRIVGLASDTLGFVLIVLAAFGRIWSSLYISGYKEDRVVSEGPNAIVRNPLYISSFFGVFGRGWQLSVYRFWRLLLAPFSSITLW
jgi:protein-S-isoprenylcysteine O-methyltransferase Ste14